MKPTPPLILTISLDRNSQDYFSQLRSTYYPKHCNYIDAHLTLFHRLPSANDKINHLIQEFSNRRPLSLQVTGIKNLGKGVAFSLFSSELQELHKEMQRALGGYLIRRDRYAYWPHITIQHQVTALKAQKTVSILLQNFKPFTVQGTGIATWHFSKGRWEAGMHYLFK